MNNKKMIEIYNLGAIVNTLNTLENNEKDQSSLQELRVMLAELWLNYALKMQRLSNYEGKNYREKLAEETMILSAIGLFEECRHVMGKKPSA